MPTAPARIARAVQRAVDARDAGVCRRCGRAVGEDFSRHHRIPRGAGGSGLVDRPSNVVTVCGSGTTGCHGRIESERAAHKTLGWILPKLNPDIDPETEPVFTHEYGWVLLGDNGSITPCSAPHRAVT